MGRAGIKAARLAAAENETVRAALLSNHVNPEDAFMAAVPLAKRRMRGQFFTPAPIANLMAEWVCAKKPARILDPTAGTGVLLRAVKDYAPNAQITAYEIDAMAAEMALAHTPGVDVRVADFLQSGDETFDAVIANPPYVRHHDINGGAAVMKDLSARTGVAFSGLSNIYVAFIVRCFEALKDGGRAGVLVPTEWANANFGEALKTYLRTRDALRGVIWFSHSGAIFEGNLSTACILLMEKSARAEKRVQGWFVDGANVGSFAALERIAAPRTFTADELYGARKWNGLFEHGASALQDGFVPLSDLAATMRGLATGANGFFHLSAEDAAHAGISAAHLSPCVGRASDVAGLMFTGDDFAALEARGKRTRLVDLCGALSDAEAAYVKRGEDDGLPARYLLGARTPWYAQERRTPAPIWAAVFGRTSMRFILNAAGVHSLTTFHGIYPKDNRAEFAKALCACLNSEAVQEMSRAERRVYGGGLSKFEPRDVLNIPVPDLRSADARTLQNLCAAFDNLVREDTTQTRAALNDATLNTAQFSGDAS